MLSGQEIICCSAVRRFLPSMEEGGVGRSPGIRTEHTKGEAREGDNGLGGY